MVDSICLVNHSHSLFSGSWKCCCHDGSAGELSASERFQLQFQQRIHSAQETSNGYGPTVPHALGIPHSNN